MNSLEGKEIGKHQSDEKLAQHTVRVSDRRPSREWHAKRARLSPSTTIM